MCCGMRLTVCRIGSGTGTTRPIRGLLQTIAASSAMLGAQAPLARLLWNESGKHRAKT